MKHGRGTALNAAIFDGLPISSDLGKRNQFFLIDRALTEQGGFRLEKVKQAGGTIFALPPALTYVVEMMGFEPTTPTLRT